MLRSSPGSGLSWDPFAFLTRLGETCGNGLFAAPNVATFAATAAFRGAAFIAVHLALFVLAGAGGVSAPRPFLLSIVSSKGTGARFDVLAEYSRDLRLLDPANRQQPDSRPRRLSE
jgi:hypothetical protein